MCRSKSSQAMVLLAQAQMRFQSWVLSKHIAHWKFYDVERKKIQPTNQHWDANILFGADTHRK